MKNKEHHCYSCNIKFRVRHSTKEPIAFCPFCGEEQGEEILDEDEEIYEEGLADEEEEEDDSDDA